MKKFLPFGYRVFIACLPSRCLSGYRAIIFSCFIFSISDFLNAQTVNLVPNPSFEQLDSSCTKLCVSIYFCTSWDSLVNGGGSAAAVLNSCYNYTTGFSVPKNILGGTFCFQVPKTGNSYAYLEYFKNSAPSVSWRSYAQAPLKTTLTNGKVYCVTYYASLSNRCQYAVDELGAYLDNGSIASIAPNREAIVSPQIKSPSGVFYKDTLNWMKVQGTFTATGNESYITIGNFKSWAAATYSLSYPTAPGFVAEYYVDDVSVIDLNLLAYAGPDKYILNGDSAFIGQPPEIGLECAWYNGTVTIGTGGGLWVKPNTTTTYIVQQNICGLIKSDTVTVTVGYAGVNESELFSKNISFYPQPSKDILNISLNFFYEKSIEIKIIDLNGRLVRGLELGVRSGVAQLETTEFSNGIYIVQIKNLKEQIAIKRLVIAR